MKPSTLETRLIEFAIQTMDVVDQLPNSLAGKHLGSQLIRSGMAPALNYGEAQGAESREDFIHKMKICQKELRESMANLRIIQKLKYVPDDILLSLLQENDELISIFVASVKTASLKKKSSIQ